VSDSSDEFKVRSHSARQRVLHRAGDCPTPSAKADTE